MAADLLAQAEHDRAAQAILITDDGGFADRVCAAVEAQLETLPPDAVARASWQRFGIVVVLPDLAEAPALIDRFARSATVQTGRSSSSKSMVTVGQSSAALGSLE